MQTLLKYLKLSSLILLSYFAVACASNPSENINSDHYIFNDLEEVTSIREFDIDSWTEVDQKSLIVNTSPRKSYLIILKQENRDLRYAHAISFGKQGRIYSKFDRINIINTTQGITPPPAYIERIYKLTGKDQKQTVIAKIKDKNKSKSKDKDKSSDH